MVRSSQRGKTRPLLNRKRCRLVGFRHAFREVTRALPRITNNIREVPVQPSPRRG
jgi:hypothetical protein